MMVDSEHLIEQISKYIAYLDTLPQQRPSGKAEGSALYAAGLRDMAQSILEGIEQEDSWQSVQELMKSGGLKNIPPHWLEGGSAQTRRESMTPINLDTLPKYMNDLPCDDRGYPVPWFVAWHDGKPEFRAMDNYKWIRAVKEKLCWVCGNRMGVHITFVAGPMCGINRTTSEPPCHLDCARWSALNCPFLSNPRMVRREDDVINNATTKERVGGHAITRNPGVAMLWTTRSYDVFNDGTGKPLITMGEPESVEWYASGRVATRAEVQESIDTGLPILEAMARREEGGLAALDRYVKRFERYLPTETHHA